jgi:hypothetical protein
MSYLYLFLAQLEVEKQFFATSLSVLEDQSIDMLIGLDMLRRHRVINHKFILFSRKKLLYGLVCH